MATMLAVDDMRSMRDLVQSVLEKRGHTVVTRDDGHSALRYAQHHAVVLVIPDINRPNMNDIPLVDAPRKLPDYQAAPILMLTTEDARHKKNEARAAGANGWIQKPFNPERLVNAVDKRLSRRT